MMSLIHSAELMNEHNLMIFCLNGFVEYCLNYPIFCHNQGKALTRLQKNL